MSIIDYETNKSVERYEDLTNFEQWQKEWTQFGKNYKCIISLADSGYCVDLGINGLSYIKSQIFVNDKEQYQGYIQHGLKKYESSNGWCQIYIDDDLQYKDWQRLVRKDFERI